MDRVEIWNVEPPVGYGLQISTEAYVAALSDRYADRGLVRAVQKSAAEQIQKEKETGMLAPDSYRLSTLSEAAIAGRYRRGKDSMSVSDLLLYFKETRRGRIRNADFSGNTGIDECTGSNVKNETALSVQKPKHDLPTTLSGRARSIARFVKEGIPTWFDSAKPDTSANQNRFPLSAFATLLAVAASLMLIVSSSVLLTRAESNISRLKNEVSAVSSEVAELKSDFEVQVDLLEIRRIAMEEYGMVEEDYVKMDYIVLGGEETVESFEEKRTGSVGLPGLLSAIGIKK